MKNKKIMLIIITILSILLIGVVGAFVALYFMTDIFRSSDQLFSKYLFQENDLIDILKIENLEMQNEFRNNNSHTSKGKLLLEISEEGAESQKIQIITNSKHDIYTKRSFSEAILKNGETDLFDISYINSSNVYAIESERVYPYYIGVRNQNLKQFAKNMGLADEHILQIPDVISFATAEKLELISQEDLKYFVDTYSQVIINSITKDKYNKTGKNTITIDDKNYQAEGYVLTLNQEDIKKILINILTKAKDDSDTLTILENILYSLKLEEEQIAQVDFKKEIQELIDKLQKEAERKIKLEIIVYQANRKTIRTQVRINDEYNIIFDIANNTKDVKKVIITAETLNIMEDDNSKGTISTQLTLEKINSDNGTINSTNISINNGENSYEILANTNLGNINNNTFYNVSNISIQGNNSIIDISYDQTTQSTTEPIEIQELMNSNTVIANNYSKEQLEVFLESVINKYREVLSNAAMQLNLSMKDETDFSNYVQGVAGVALAIGNANGLEPVANITGATAITALNFLIQTQMQIHESANDAINNINLQEQTVQQYNAKFIQYEGKQIGSAIKNLCNTVKTHNMTSQNISEQVKLQLFSSKQITIEEVETITNRIQINKNYNVDFGYNSEGKIVAIGIVEVQ